MKYNISDIEIYKTQIGAQVTPYYSLAPVAIYLPKSYNCIAISKGQSAREKEIKGGGSKC